MADTHIEVTEGLYHARQLMDPIRTLTTGMDRLESLRDAMSRMKDGDGSQAAHFAKVVDLFGVKGVDSDEKLARAKTLFDEVNSAMGNSAALLQLLNILG